MRVIRGHVKAHKKPGAADKGALGAVVLNPWFSNSLYQPK